MEIVIFAEQFKNGNWDVWEHLCSPQEAAAVVDTARVRATVRSNGRPIHADFLESSRSIFNVEGGLASAPKDGDLRVYCVCVDRVVIGNYEKIHQYSQRLAGIQEFVKVASKEPLGRHEAGAAARFA
jgi:hypothetical protein